MLRRSWLFVLLTLLLAGSFMAAEPAGLPALQGTWRVFSAEKGNRQLTAEEIAPLKVIIEGKQFKLLSKEQPLLVATLALPAKPGVRAIDFNVTQPEPSKSLGIYEFAGAKLRLCWDNQINERPATFTGTNESASLILLLLERVAP